MPLAAFVPSYPRIPLTCGFSHPLQVTLYSMYVAIMAFNAKVSDPLIGGTYMTLLNTVSNLGGNWPSTVALWLVDPLTVKECVGAQEQACGTPAAAEVSLEAVKVSVQLWLHEMASLSIFFFPPLKTFTEHSLHLKNPSN